jgi:hypothetical protein
MHGTPAVAPIISNFIDLKIPRGSSLIFLKNEKQNSS